MRFNLSRTWDRDCAFAVDSSPTAPLLLCFPCSRFDHPSGVSSAWASIHHRPVRWPHATVWIQSRRSEAPIRCNEKVSHPVGPPAISQGRVGLELPFRESLKGGGHPPVVVSASQKPLRSEGKTKRWSCQFTRSAFCVASRQPGRDRRVGVANLSSGFVYVSGSFGLGFLCHVLLTSI